MSITLRGCAGTTRNIAGTATSRLFTIASGATLALEDVSVSGFQAQDGGAIVNQGTLAVVRSVFRNNKSLCSGSGAMTAFATCGSGAIANSGTLTLGDDTLFDTNVSKASATTASYTTASTSGGAIGSSGTLTIDGSVTFQHNSAIAEALSGIHPSAIGGAWATASGGAIASLGGTLTVTAAARGRCAFLSNDATANAASVYGTATPSSTGGGVAASGTVTGIPDGCVFTGNTALTAPDASVNP